MYDIYILPHLFNLYYKLILRGQEDLPQFISDRRNDNNINYATNTVVIANRGEN